jgi:peptidoglycan/LPS O-acetylase OafA/YrhL
MNRRPSFRPDIQGMRAVAVCAVVFYHADFPGFSGGFFGVDVFFVISGFLIVGMLIDEVGRTGCIDAFGFWARRARRLLPNATLTLLCTALLAAIFLPGNAKVRLAWDIGSAATYWSNYRFAASALDYFSMDDPPSPAMHFWSLSVEEQFYLFWPLILVFALTIRAKQVREISFAILGFIFCLSLFAALYLYRDNQSMAFFHAEARWWQLAAGGMLAYFIRQPLSLPRRLEPIVGWFGLIAIAYCISLTDDAVDHPGAHTLVTTLGAVAVIVGWQHSDRIPGPGLILNLKFLQWLGSRSYSWYLWHWPTFIAAQSMFPGERTALILAVPISLALASFAYTFVEAPFRKTNIRSNASLATLSTAAASVVVVVVASISMANFRGLVERGSRELLADLQKAKTDRGRNYSSDCHIAYDVTMPKECNFGDVTSQKTVVLFGDSHAAQWFEPLDSAASSRGWKFQSWTKTSCPSVDVTVWFAPRRAPYVACDEWRENVLRMLTNGKRPDLLVIANRVDYDGWIMDRQSNRVLRKDSADHAWRQGFAATLTRAAEAGIPVIVLRDTPKAFKSFRECLASGGATTCDRPRALALPKRSSDVEVSAQFPGKVNLVDFSDMLCDTHLCPTIKNGMVVYSDYHHLTSTFAKSMAPEFERLLGE